MSAREMAEKLHAATQDQCPECGTKGHDPARLDRNPSGWCDACIMATSKVVRRRARKAAGR